MIVRDERKTRVLNPVQNGFLAPLEVFLGYSRFLMKRIRCWRNRHMNNELTPNCAFIP